MTITLDMNTDYLIQNDLLEIRQSTKLGESSVVKLHKNDIEMLAQRFGLNDSSDQYQIHNEVAMDMRELFWLLEENADSIRKLDYIKLDQISLAINALYKHIDICKLVGLTPKEWVNRPLHPDELPF
jgi:hypothetical protein